MNQLITFYIPSKQDLGRVKTFLGQIHILRRLFKAYHQRLSPLIATFVGFSKAFDSIDRNYLFKILRHKRIPLKITDAITAMYTNSSSQQVLLFE